MKKFKINGLAFRLPYFRACSHDIWQVILAPRDIRGSTRCRQSPLPG